MTRKEHRARHKMLHAFMDELVADFLRHNPTKGLRSSLLELMEWSHSQTIEPTRPPRASEPPESN